MAVDKYSVTSPQRILDAFSAIGLNSTTWTDEDIVPHAGRKFFRKFNLSDQASLDEKHRVFLYKQIVFYKQCSKVLTEENRTWTMFVDTDEYLSFNYFRQEEIGGRKQTYKCLNDKAQHCRTSGSPIDTLRKLNTTFQDNETIIEFLERNSVQLSMQKQSHCMYLPRVQHGAIEEDHKYHNEIGNPTSTYRDTLPDVLDKSAFRTLRYRLHDSIRNRLAGKSIVDMSRFQEGINHINNPHKIGLDQCYNGEVHTMSVPDASRSFFRVHHYTGSYEEFLARPGDPIRSTATFQQRNNYTVQGRADKMTIWISTFIESIGLEHALNLTQKMHRWARAKPTTE